MGNQVILFLSPVTEDDGLPMGPTSVEYRPFVRALPEFQLWSRGCVASTGAFLASFVDDLDLEVDGRALALYFIVLFAYTMKQQITHMLKYGYVPWNTKKGKAEKDKAMDV